MFPKKTSTGIHLVLNFLGRNIGEGIQAFRDGTLRQASSGGASNDATTGFGQVVVGRRYVNSNQDYAHVEVDELIFFNQALTEDDVSDLYSMYK